MHKTNHQVAEFATYGAMRLVYPWGAWRDWATHKTLLEAEKSYYEREQEAGDSTEIVIARAPGSTFAPELLAALKEHDVDQEKYLSYYVMNRRKTYGVSITSLDNRKTPNEWRLGSDQSYPMYVNAYHKTLEYGGAEEGGWWYDQYDFLGCLRAINQADATQHCEMLWDRFVGDVHDDQPASNYHSGGRLVVKTESKIAESETRERPHYE